MTPVRGGIDQPAAAAAVDEPIAGPEVAVQAGGRFRRTAPKSARRSARPVRARAIVEVAERVGVTRELGQRAQPIVGIELCPRRARIVRETAAAGRAAILASEAGAPARCNAASAVAERSFRRPAPTAPRRSIRARAGSAAGRTTASTSGTGMALGGAQPLEPRRLGGEEVRAARSDASSRTRAGRRRDRRA